MISPNKREEPLVYELSRPGRRGIQFPDPDVPRTKLPSSLLREDLNLPEITQLDAVRHFQRLSQLNHSIDSGFYPLGSCTICLLYTSPSPRD